MEESDFQIFMVKEPMVLFITGLGLQHFLN